MGSYGEKICLEYSGKPFNEHAKEGDKNFDSIFGEVDDSGNTETTVSWDAKLIIAREVKADINAAFNNLVRSELNL